MDIYESNYKKIEKERNEVCKKLRAILKDKNVQTYIKLDEECDKLNKDLKEAYKALLMEKYRKCEHVLVCCSSTCEYEYGGKSHSYYGCIKCGLSEEALDTDYPLTFEERVMAYYLKTSISRRINGKKTGVGLNLEEATTIYNDLKERFPELDEDGLIEMFKTKVNLSDISRKKKL